MELQTVSVIPGRTKNSIILHVGDGFYYLVKEVRRRRVRLMCRHRRLGCKGNASLVFNHANKLVLRALQPHSCINDPRLPEDRETWRKLIQEAKNSLTGASIRKLLRDFKLRLDPDMASRFTVSRMHSKLYEARSSKYPKIPSTLVYLGVLLGLPGMRSVCLTQDKMDFMFQGVVGNQASKTVSVIFASGRMLMFLQTLKNLHVDGTFKKRPRKPHCCQLYNVVTKFGDGVVAVMRIIMRSRSENAYLELFGFIKQLAPNLQPTRIHCDFERATINALRKTFPLSDIVGCLWHFGVCVGRNAVKKNLSRLASENDLIHSFIRCICGAPLLPATLIEKGVEEIWTEVVTSGWGETLQPLFSYFKKEWVPRVHELSVYSQPERTNNCSESDNRCMANFIPQNHPNIWTLIAGIVQLEHISWSDKLAIEKGNNVQCARRWKTAANDKRMRRLTELLNHDQISPGRFLHEASWINQGALNHGMKLDTKMNSDSDDSDSE
ncbi:(2R)-sulfolactate sulfo-lyase subunit beta [Frankliniella fusca]|uniref:(2R)-sulfolactate sulfo-lyase subunit beta n=1 Tax=Frankliniella fusca TaxID=407009 RepID=A0AAE1LNL5_9NEOP|nr:(2R)-sulfolactate sulfo-lyase subunit beta [Frankliniella fusca]KAK3924640.1 (2R)-sulfolactate sulfo-lyase subunit beta [Frankliniella fusca]